MIGTRPAGRILAAAGGAYLALTAMWIAFSHAAFILGGAALFGLLLVWGRRWLAASDDRLRQAREAIGSLAESRERYHLFAESTHDIVLFTSRSGRLLDANRAALLAYGYDRQELVGLTHADLCAGNSPSLDPLEGSAAGVRYETTHRRKSGETFPVEVSRTVAAMEGEPVVLFIVRDISARRVREAARHLLHEFDLRILGNEPLESVLRFLCDRAAEIYGLGVVQVSLKGAGGSIEIRAAGGPASAFTRRVNARWDDTLEGRGPTGTAIRTGEMAIVEVSSDPEFAPWREKAEKHGLRVGLAVPLTTGEETIGALTAYSSRPGMVNPETVAWLRGFADQVVLLLLSARDREQINLKTAALEAAANAVMITDRNGAIRWVNPAFTALTGYAPEEAIGQTPRILRSGVQGESFYREMWKSIQGGHTWRGELFNQRKDGTRYAEEQTITPVRDREGAIVNFIAVKQDITLRRSHEEEIRFLASHDPLTGLPNRRSFEETLGRTVEQARRGRRAIVLLLDLDHFKVINDSAGHATGDRALVTLVRLLRESIRPGDLLARFGGDEFALLLDDVDVESARDLAERLRSATDEFRYRVGDQVFNLSVSIGLCPVDGVIGAEAVMALADRALYAAKERGRNRIVVFRHLREAKLHLAEESHWASRVKDALKDDRFALQFQPVVRLADGSHQHVEALLRMRDEGNRLIPPTRFLRAAERFGLMSQIDRWVLERILATLASHEGLDVFMNLSGASLGDPAFLEYAERRVREAQLHRGRLVFEVTESAAVADLAAVQQWTLRLKDMGCHFAIDDFGTGFSSFRYLVDIPADFVKIDGSFVRNLETSAQNRALVHAITGVSHALGKEVIAEAVENAAVLAVLQALGVELGQGYHLGMPGGLAAETPAAAL